MSTETYYSEVKRLLEEVVPAKFSSQPRSGQVDMALAVAEALQNGGTLAVEAGTGVGKSLAYLIPAVLWRLNGGAYPSVVSTKTINLQAQLINKDIPTVQEIMLEQYGERIQVAQALGKGNYLCQRRLANALQRRDEYAKDERVLIAAIALKVSHSTSAIDDTMDLFVDETAEELAGVKEEFSGQGTVWKYVCCDTWLCAGRKCRFFSKCFLWSARRRLMGADLVVANHALVLSDAALRRDGADGILPSIKCLIFDEAHNLGDVATDHLGFSFSPTECNMLLNRLVDRQVERQGEPSLITRMNDNLPLLADVDDQNELVSIVDRLQYSSIDNLNGALDGFFAHLREVYTTQAERNNHITITSDQIDNDGDGDSLRQEGNEIEVLFGGLSSLLGEASRFAARCDDTVWEEIRETIDFAKSQVQQLCTSLQFCLDCDNPDWVNWVEVHTRTRSGFGKEETYVDVGLKAAPLEIGGFIRQHLFDSTNTLVLTSATLQVNKSMFFFLRGVGLPMPAPQQENGIRALVCTSPFNYRTQAFLGVATDSWEPQTMGQYRVCLGELVRLISAIEGRTLLLFTSRDALNIVAEQLSHLLRPHGIRVLCQKGNNRQAIVEEFRTKRDCVLCGIDSFWEGVDVPGDALQCVVIFKVPFPVPTEPVHAARMQKIESEKGSSFNDYMVPLAITKLRQGTGRLIRSVSDKGIILLLDSRVHSKRSSYGGKMLNSLPACTCQHRPLEELIDSGLSWLGRGDGKGRFTE